MITEQTRYDDMKAERDTSIDDVVWLRAKIKRLERENDDFLTSVSNKVKSIWQLERENEQLQRKALGYDKMMTGQMGELYSKAKAFDEVIEIYDNCYDHSDRNFIREIDRVVDNFESEHNYDK